MPSMPLRVEPVPSALVALYPWDQAGTALAAINEALTVLGAQLDARPHMIDAIFQWAGSYRRDFDETYNRLVATATDTKEHLTRAAADIVEGAESANIAQQRFNEAAATARVDAIAGVR